jgi:purine nucleosidase
LRANLDRKTQFKFCQNRASKPNCTPYSFSLEANMRALLIDTDPGVDDGLAVLMCLHESSVQLRALTVLGGNVGLAHTTRNACTLADLAGTTLKVYAGAARPLVGQAPDAAFVHGSDGFGDANLPAPRSKVEATHAALAIIEQANACAGELEILALGPLTNIALALALDPTLPSKVKRLTVMGGAVRAQGNITAFAEFNIAVDPEAAQSVLTRWPNAELVDWEATMKFAPSIAETERWFASESALAKFMHTISRKTLTFKHSIAGALGADARWAWADPLAAYVALYPERCIFQRAGVEVIREGAARGATLLNIRESSLKILTEIVMQDFHAVMVATLGVPLN